MKSQIDKWARESPEEWAHRMAKVMVDAGEAEVETTLTFQNCTTDTLTITNDSLTWAIKTPVYECEKHGEVEYFMWAGADKYCLVCYAEMMAEHCCVVKEL